MRLKTFKPFIPLQGPKLDKTMRGVLEQQVKLVHRKAVEGKPYTALSIIDEINKGADISLPMALLTEVLNCLVTNPAWRTCGEWGIFVRGEKDISLTVFLEGALSRDVPYPVNEIIELIEILTEEQPESGTVRKALDRLVDTGRFEKLRPGEYRKTFRGM